MFCIAKAWKMTVAEEELCSSAVKATPNNTVRIGFSSEVRSARNAAVSESGAMADFISVIPWKSIPKPRMTEPTSRSVLFLRNRFMTAPMNRIIGA